MYNNFTAFLSSYYTVGGRTSDFYNVTKIGKLNNKEVVHGW